MQTTEAGTRQFDVVIVGGGPAGLSAALMLGRARRSVLVIDAGQPRNRAAAHMHGLLSRDGMSPLELLERGRLEASRYGVQFAEGVVTGIDRIDGGFRVHGPESISARRVVVATGLVDVLPDVPGVQQLWGTAAVVCPYCDGWEVRDQPLGVIATSPMSRNQAHLLRQWTSELTVFGAAEAGIPEVELAGLRARGIRLAPAALEVSGSLGELEVRTGDGTHRVSRVFVGARPRPSDALLTSLGCATLDTPAGPFVSTDPSGQTSVDGVWAIGNVADMKALVPISLGAGTHAATQINISLLEEEIAKVVV
ncbi:thioredoxin reductase [Diaminobutyricimonas aerilata]|uniref:Thioredoxin reductase n=1 Tax=Diaminobutyricimonas aerilata TaxID=1162967 RepID=A0A2M9CP17_9MICO|nr:NAD(P)/FAD-dependent oxidoreductase [Diaminobutyricimonas aerilata]PJJ73624.1 thioredoxin reductase [Diaminobutyricimonas aerilata]